MNKWIRLCRKGLWILGQPLTKKPKKSGDPVSELFVWRNSPDWNTYFELIDIASLFEEKLPPRLAIFVFFNADGTKFHEEEIELSALKRITFDLSLYVSKSKDSIGTFCVFHETPDIVKQLGAFITDRGYVSYRYKKSLIRCFVHGNFDATSYSPDGTLKMLGVTSLLRREYRLQYEFRFENYEIVLVNSTSSEQIVSLNIVHVSDIQSASTFTVKLKPREVNVFPIKNVNGKRAIITSRIVMARPYVFCYRNHQMTVFHG